jgi:hypothetical protein
MSELRKAAQAVGDELSGYNDDGKYDKVLDDLRIAIDNDMGPIAAMSNPGFKPRILTPAERDVFNAALRASSKLVAKGNYMADIVGNRIVPQTPMSVAEVGCPDCPSTPRGECVQRLCGVGRASV